MRTLWWFVLIAGCFALALLVGFLAVGQPVPEDQGEVVRRFMSASGPFIVVGGVALVAVSMLDDRDE